MFRLTVGLSFVTKQAIERHCAIAAWPTADHRRGCGRTPRSPTSAGSHPSPLQRQDQPQPTQTLGDGVSMTRRDSHQIRRRDDHQAPTMPTQPCLPCPGHPGACLPAEGMFLSPRRRLRGRLARGRVGYDRSRCAGRGGTRARSATAGLAAFRRGSDRQGRGSATTCATTRPMQSPGWTVASRWRDGQAAAGDRHLWHDR